MVFKTLCHRAALFTLALSLAFGMFFVEPAFVQAETAEKEEVQEEESNYDRWMDVCDTMLKNLKKYRFRYGNNGVKSTYKQGKARGRRCNCALYVSWCLQQYGAIDFGDKFYVKGSGKLWRNFRWDSDKVKVIRVYKRCSSTKLKPGDVVCWSGTAHANIYAGRSKSGKRLWYDGGKVATRGNHRGSRYSKTGKQAYGYLNRRRISYVIRIKDVNK